MSSWSETTNTDYLSRDEKLDRSLFLFFICKRFVDAHNIDRGVLVSVSETVSSIVVSILTSRYTTEPSSELGAYSVS